jgi:hypothetical protein
VKLPESVINPLLASIDDALESHQEPPRPHMGVSTIGQVCERRMWLGFRWAVIERFQGRILRLFQRGHNEEPVMAGYLRKAGLDLRFTGFDQKRVDFGSHVSGSMDGVIVSGVPEAPAKPHLWENKTHGEKSFREVARDGVEKAKPDHYAQAQGYMEGTFSPKFQEENGFGKIDRVLYTAVNKNTDEIYIERIRLDRPKARGYVERAQRIATADRMPPGVSTDPSWYVCKMCPMSEFCHTSKVTKEVNCRTCAHSTAEVDGTWSCALHPGPGQAIPVEFQRTGCRSHVLHPDLVPWEMKEGVGNSARYVREGAVVVNGEDGTDSRGLVGPSALVGVVKEAGDVIEWPLV